MKSRHQHPVFQPYSDVLLNVLGTFIVIVTVLILTLNVKSKNNLDSHPKAEYLVTLTWDDKRNVDLDLWLQDPYGHVIYYLNRESRLVSLDRDSRGYVTNKVTLENGLVIQSENREVITIRSVLPGDYVVAVSYYNGMDDTHTYTFSPPDPLAGIDFKVRLEKVNPHLSTVFDKEFHFSQVKEAFNVLAFHVADDGKVTITDLPIESLVEQHGGAPHP